MGTFLLTWNPKHWQWDDLPETVERVRRGEGDDDRWSAGVTRSGISPGDRFFILRQGKEPRGIFGSGEIRSKVYQDAHWNDGRDGEANYVNVRFDTLVDPDEEPERIIPIADLIERFQDRHYFKRVQASGQRLPDDVAEEIEALWRERYGEPERRTESARLAEELPENHAYFEGAVSRVEINAYERNLAARRACVAHYGPTCRVCGFDFERTYGPTGRDFVHVHHLKGLARIGEEYQLDPIRDLRPVCPNCHAMIHRQEPPLKIKELRRIVREIRQRRRSRQARMRRAR